MKKISLSDKIFIAGSTGMVGKAVIKKFRKEGYGENKFGGKILKPTRKELNLLKQNVVEEWFEFNKPEIVILAAAKVGGIVANSKYPADFILENLKIQINVIESAFKFGVKKFLFLGSSCIYPKFAPQPINEESLLKGNLEKTNENYALAKITGIKLCQSLRLQYGFDAISLMPTNLYGPGDNYHPTNSHVIPGIIRRIYGACIDNAASVSCWGSGKPMREFLYVDDLADAILFAIENWDPDNKSAPLDNNGLPHLFLNVGTGKDISIKDLSEKISKIINYKGELDWDKSKPDGTPKKLLNIENFRALGWKPKTTLDEGLKKTIDDYKKNVV